MKFYSILYNDKISKEEEAWVAYDDGFSIIAFLCSVVWAFFHNLWMVVGVLIAILISLTQLEIMGVINFFEANVIKSLIAIYVGLEAKSWYIDKLQKSGYVLQDVIMANSSKEALLKFYTKSHEINEWK